MKIKNPIKWPALVPKLPKQLKRTAFSRPQLAVFIIAFALIGGYFIYKSFAASLPIVYVAQAQAGTADGSSCANAKAVSFFNTASNWGTNSAQIGPGTTVHLCGTITSPIAAQGSGASGCYL